MLNEIVWPCSASVPRLGDVHSRGGMDVLDEHPAFTCGVDAVDGSSTSIAMCQIAALFISHQIRLLADCVDQVFLGSGFGAVAENDSHQTGIAKRYFTKAVQRESDSSNFIQVRDSRTLSIKSAQSGHRLHGVSTSAFAICRSRDTGGGAVYSTNSEHR